MRLSDADRTALKAIVSAGGLRRLDDIVRIELCPEDPRDRARWARLEPRLAERILNFCKARCGPKDVALYEDSLVTVLVHPQSELQGEALRAELLIALTALLNGIDETPVAKAVISELSPHNLAEIIESASQPQKESKPPTTPDAIETPFSYDEEVVQEQVTPRFQRVPVQHGADLIGFLFRPQNIDELQALVNQPYDASSLELLKFDLFGLSTAANEVLREKTDTLARLFMLNINNFRVPDYRTRVFAEIRKIPAPAHQRLHPVIVRRDDGFPDGVLSELVGYLKSVFPATWVYHPRLEAAAELSWLPTGAGLMLENDRGAPPGSTLSTDDAAVLKRRDINVAVVPPRRSPDWAGGGAAQNQVVLRNC